MFKLFSFFTLFDNKNNKHNIDADSVLKIQYWTSKSVKNESNILTSLQILAFCNYWNNRKSIGLTKYIPQYYLEITLKNGNKRNFRLYEKTIKEDNDCSYKLKNTNWLTL